MKLLVSVFLFFLSRSRSFPPAWKASIVPEWYPLCSQSCPSPEEFRSWRTACTMFGKPNVVLAARYRLSQQGSNFCLKANSVRLEPTSAIRSATKLASARPAAVISCLVSASATRPRLTLCAPHERKRSMARTNNRSITPGGASLTRRIKSSVHPHPPDCLLGAVASPVKYP
jgi:hypothetical protein